jgi:hypothetical protein
MSLTRSRSATEPWVRLTVFSALLLSLLLKNVAVHSGVDSVVHNEVRAYQGIHRWLGIGRFRDDLLPAPLPAQDPLRLREAGHVAAFHLRTSRSPWTLHPTPPPTESLVRSQVLRGSSVGASSPSNHAVTAASRYANTDRPC